MLKSALIWHTQSGRELIRLTESSDEATIIPMTVRGESDLRELAKAAAEAADQIAAFKADAKPGQPR